MKYKPLVYSLLASLIIGGGLGVASYFYFSTVKKDKKISNNKNNLVETNDLKTPFHNKLDKYEILEITTDYKNYLTNKTLYFSNNLIQKNLYNYIEIKLDKYVDLNKDNDKLNLSLFYELNFNCDCLKIKVKWKKIPKNLIDSEFVKSFFDVFQIEIKNNKR